MTMMMVNCLQPNTIILASPFPRAIQDNSLKNNHININSNSHSNGKWIRYVQERQPGRSRIIANGFMLPVDPWAPSMNIDSQSIASQLFAFSLFPYIAFLYFITKSKSAPKLTLFGFYFLLAFVGATIPSGIYAKVQYGTSLSNVDYLHGGAESLLTLTNLFIVLGLRSGIRKAKDEKETTSNLASGIRETDKSST